MCLDQCRERTTFEAAAAARDAGVVAGLREYVPRSATNSHRWPSRSGRPPTRCPIAGRVLFGTCRDWPRPDDPLLSAWLAVNCIREWRGDTHWAIQIAEDIGQVEAGILDGAWRELRRRLACRAAAAPTTPRSRRRSPSSNGAASPPTVPSTIAASSTARSWRTASTTSPAWRGSALGEERTLQFLDLVEPVGARLVERIDLTAGPNWMPAARDRPPR